VACADTADRTRLENRVKLDALTKGSKLSGKTSCSIGAVRACLGSAFVVREYSLPMVCP